jgi:hypothetical protein
VSPPRPLGFADKARILATLRKNIQNYRARKCGCHPYATLTPGAINGIAGNPAVGIIMLHFRNSSGSVAIFAAIRLRSPRLVFGKELRR